MKRVKAVILKRLIFLCRLRLDEGKTCFFVIFLIIAVCIPPKGVAHDCTCPVLHYTQYDETCIAVCPEPIPGGGWCYYIGTRFEYEFVNLADFMPTGETVVLQVPVEVCTWLTYDDCFFNCPLYYPYGESTMYVEVPICEPWTHG